MDGEISGVTKTEVLRAIRNRYRKASKKDKSRMLDEFVAIMGCHRKHAVRLLRQGEEPTAPSAPKGQRIYDEAVREALTVVWEASDRICGKRLKAALPSMVESLERHGHLDLDPGVRRRLFSASAATIDRLMRPIREQAGSRRKRKQKRKMAGRIPVRTFSDWKEPEPGYLEIDLVAHCGGTVTGSYISSLVVTDVCSGWTEAIPLLAREQSLVVTGLEAVSRIFPVPIRGINSDNDSVFINETLLNYCEERDIKLTRSRAYRKNDQAWIEQKNGSVIRRFVGHERYSGPMAGQTMAHLYGAMRLYVNHFQPSFQLLERTRDGGTVKKRYGTPATPCDRLLWRDDVSEELKTMLRDSRAKLDPVSLLHTIREAQSALATINALRLPRRGPLSLLKGATPTRAAIRLRLRVPNSGKYASSDNESCSPTPGTERSRSSFSRHTGLLRRVFRRSLSRSLSSCSSQLMWDRMLGCTEWEARLRRFFSATSIVISWLRRVVREFSS